MARSHPPTLLRLTERALAEECGLARGDGVLVAVSGGSDSSALLHVLARLAPPLGLRLSAHGVDHGLRAEAASELDGAERLAASLGVPFRRTGVSVRPGGNLQARAREARRAALEAARTSDGATVIATAHHADDRAETVLIRLLHGAGPGALAVLPARDGVWVRPFVRARKADVVEHLARHHVAHANDPSNRDPRFLRVRVRLELIPLLEVLSPRIVNHLTALADALAGGQASSAWRPGFGGLRRAHLEALERALRLGKGARIRLPGNLDLAVEPEGPEISVEAAASLPRGTQGERAKRCKRCKRCKR